MTDKSDEIRRDEEEFLQRIKDGTPLPQAPRYAARALQEAMSHGTRSARPGENGGPPRKPWVAFLLTLLTPGLGHVYNGDLTGGIIRYAVVTVGLSAAFASWAYALPSIVGLVIVLVAAVVTVVGVAVTASRQSRQVPADAPRFWYGRWYGVLAVLVVVNVTVDPLRSAGMKYFAQAYKIPSGAMLSTLLIGDHIYVTKLCYGLKLPFTDRFLVTFHPPERGDIVVFILNPA